jgi:replicative DNA helicase
MYNVRAIQKVLTAIYKDNNLLVAAEYPLKVDDFALKKYKAIYQAMHNLYVLGNTKIDLADIEGYFLQQQKIYKKFVEDEGMDALYEVCQDDGELNFEYHYKTLKKYALLRDLAGQGIDITDLYNENLSPNDLERQLAKFHALEIDDVFKHYLLKISVVENNYHTLLEKTCQRASENLADLVNALQTIPEVGMPLNGDIYNTIVRGARLKKLYIDSGSTGSGKSRRFVGNACKLAFPMYYDVEKKEWVNTQLQEKVLFITTELEHQEIQTMVLAYVTGIDEEAILGNKCTDEEQERIQVAIGYIKAHDNLIIEYIPNPSVPIISANIKKHALQDDIAYVFYDYIHISSGLIQNRDKQLRDDVILLLLANALKELANELNIHISTSTQLSADYETKEIKNQNLIRGSKSIADKADIGTISLIPNQSELDLGAAIAAKLGTKVPNLITDVYKNRRGKWTGIRIWRMADLATCRIEDCFITNQKNEPLYFNTSRVKIQQANKTEGFVVISKEEKREADAL